MQNGYENLEFITDITWEDLQEIGIIKLGKKSRFSAFCLQLRLQSVSFSGFICCEICSLKFAWSYEIGL